MATHLDGVHKRLLYQSTQDAKLYSGLGSNLSASGWAKHMIYYQFLHILDKFWSNDLDLSSRKVKII